MCASLTLSLCLCVCVKMCTAQHMYIRVLYNETLNTIEWQMAYAFYQCLISFPWKNLTFIFQVIVPSKYSGWPNTQFLACFYLYMFSAPYFFCIHFRNTTKTIVYLTGTTEQLSNKQEILFNYKNFFCFFFLYCSSKHFWLKLKSQLKRICFFFFLNETNLMNLMCQQTISE